MRAEVWLLCRATLASSVLGCSLLGCSALGAPEPLEGAEAFRCQSDGDCSAGHCLSAFGICSANTGGLETLLFEVTPPASDPVYGGARFLKVLNLDETSAEGLPARGISPGWLELNVRPRVPVTGSVSAAPNQTACLSRARSTLPVTLTFTPRERLYGLAVASYDLTTTLDESNEYTFKGSLPPGHYDVYMRPDTSALGENCIAIPQIFRDRSIGDSFQLEQPPPRPLALTIPWKADLEGWRLDMVHPVSGEVISNQVYLSALDVDANTQTLETTLYYSRADTDPASLPSADGFIADADELVRLTPPPTPGAERRAGTILLQRSGVELATQGEGVIGDVFEFGEPVDFQSWVWLEDQFDTPVPGTVSFAARDLDEVADGVLASFDGSATVDAQGQIRLSLLPGRYRVRVLPPGIEIPQLGLLSGYETSVTVWANDNPNSVQGGHVIEVPAAVSLRGEVVTRADGKPLAGVEIRANASNSGQDPCPAPGAEQSGIPCDRPGTAVLRKALAQDPFVPRTRSTLSESNGEFAISGLDCGQCEPGAGARFDLSVRPPPEMNLPWLVRRSYNLYSNESMLIPLEVRAPVAHAVRLTYGDPAADGQARGLPGALVRVFALLDERARVFTDKATPVPCVSAAVGQHCVQSVVQVAELRSGSDGEFPLLLPPELE